MPLANTLFIDAVPPPWQRADMPRVEKAHASDGWDSKQSSAAFLEGLYNIGLSEAFYFELDPKKNPRLPSASLVCWNRTAELDLGGTR